MHTPESEAAQYESEITAQILEGHNNMKHYCRYCIHCIAQSEIEAVCEELNIIVKKASVRNACQLFDFCEIDAFYLCRSGDPEKCKYKSRIPKQKQCKGQMTLFST